MEETMSETIAQIEEKILEKLYSEYDSPGIYVDICAKNFNLPYSLIAEQLDIMESKKLIRQPTIVELDILNVTFKDKIKNDDTIVTAAITPKGKKEFERIKKVKNTTRPPKITITEHKPVQQ